MIKLVEYKVHICAIRVSLKTINLTSRLYDIYIYMYISFSTYYTNENFTRTTNSVNEVFGRSGKKKKENDCQFFIS